MQNNIIVKAEMAKKITEFEEVHEIMYSSVAKVRLSSNL